MKGNIVILLLALLTITACSDDDRCPRPIICVYNNMPSSVTIAECDPSQFFGFLEIEYGINGFTPGSGTLASIPSDGRTFDNLGNGTYDVYVRGNCGSSNWSDWTLKSFIIQGSNVNPTCPAPGSLNTTVYSYNDIYLYWSGYGDYYEIEYGPTGFTQGTGSKVNSNDYDYSFYAGLSRNTTYDWYIRANCGGVSNWSNWSGPSSFYVP